MKLGIPKSFKVLAPGNSLRKRIAYSLAIVRLILVPVIVLSIYYLFRMGSIIDSIVNVDAPAATLAQQASIEVLEARRAERNYLILRDTSYLQTNREAVQKTQDLFDQIRNLQPAELGTIEAASSSLKLYDQRFTAAVAAFK